MPGMTASLLANKMGMTYQGVKKVLDGRSKAFSASNNAKAAGLLNVNSDWLATGRGERTLANIQATSTSPIQRGAATAVWPFATASLARLEALLEQLTPQHASEALADMDRQLHRVLSDWENDIHRGAGGMRAVETADFAGRPGQRAQAEAAPHDVSEFLKS